MSGALSWTLDDRRLSGSRGMTVLEGAESAGLSIPHLCRGCFKTGGGRCRLCTGLINGRPRATCIEPLAEGMRVEFDTPELRTLRRTLLEILLAQCGKDHGTTELDAEAARMGVQESAFARAQACLPIERGPGQIVIDHARCIMCGRCERAADAAGAAGFVRVIGRGEGRRLWMDDQVQIDNACLGAIVAACPTGALRLDQSTRGKP
ncbi:MAG: (2Fe-2S)-binding protein [Phycisphaerales bacterium]|nr:(2Fe-2S)-binding protein [Phycisphaerales bacterium]